MQLKAVFDDDMPVTFLGTNASAAHWTQIPFKINMRKMASSGGLD
jgi:hypothetical protein